mgnify:CR=1 FL=1
MNMEAAGATVASEEIARSPEFRHLSSIAGIRVDLRYAGANNFVGRDLYSPFDCAWLHRDAAESIFRNETRPAPEAADGAKADRKEVE